MDDQETKLLQRALASLRQAREALVREDGQPADPSVVLRHIQQAEMSICQSVES